MWNIDIHRAQKAFYKYTEGFPEAEERIDQKIQHSVRVSGWSRNIASAIGADLEDISLATVIGLIHDIGRFEQYMTYGTYIDRQSEDHAAIGVRVLFEEGLIREFIETEGYDQIIKESIIHHNAYELPSGLENRVLMHCKLVRDSDKIDNLYVKQFETFEALFGRDDISDEPISEKIIREFQLHKLIKHTDTLTNMDTWIKYVAFHFGLYYGASLKMAYDGDYGDKMLDRVSGNSATQAIRTSLHSFFKAKLSGFDL